MGSIVFDGFGVRQPLVTMVFDGCAPLVRRWNGYVPSLKSNDHHFFDDDGNDEISMKMILTTMEAFELNYERGKTMFAQVVVCAPRSSPRCPPAVAFNAAGLCQIQSQ